MFRHLQQCLNSIVINGLISGWKVQTLKQRRTGYTDNVQLSAHIMNILMNKDLKTHIQSVIWTVQQ